MIVTRRTFVKLLTVGTIQLAILRATSLLPSRSPAEIVRPPGAVDEDLFKLLCVRCGICTEACPTRTIRLIDHTYGLDAVGTPRIDPAYGPCEFYRGRCEEVMRCTQRCPTGALRPVPKEDVKLGTVTFTIEQCLAHLGKECVVCYEMCPVPEAITLTRDLKPVFDDTKCVGCGTCVYSCPAEPKALRLRSKGARRTVV